MVTTAIIIFIRACVEVVNHIIENEILPARQPQTQQIFVEELLFAKRLMYLEAFLTHFRSGVHRADGLMVDTN